MQGIIKATYFTCQFASVFPCNHNNPVPLNCDRCGSAGQIGNICYCDNQDIAQCLERWGERVTRWENWWRAPLSTQTEKTFVFDSIHFSIILHTKQDQVYNSWQKTIFISVYLTGAVSFASFSSQKCLYRLEKKIKIHPFPMLPKISL